MIRHPQHVRYDYIRSDSVLGMKACQICGSIVGGLDQELHRRFHLELWKIGIGEIDNDCN